MRSQDPGKLASTQIQPARAGAARTLATAATSSSHRTIITSNAIPSDGGEESRRIESNRRKSSPRLLDHGSRTLKLSLVSREGEDLPAPIDLP
jgi:hypothetical protein